MRTIAILAAALWALALSSTGAAAEGSWCVQYGTQGGTNCGFHSYEQCRAAASGTGGFCYRNRFAR